MSNRRYFSASSIPDWHPYIRHSHYGDTVYAIDNDATALLLYGYYNLQIVMFEDLKFGTATDNAMDRLKRNVLLDAANLARCQVPAWINHYYYLKADGSPLQGKEEPDNLSLLAHAYHVIDPINEAAAKVLGQSFPKFVSEFELVVLNHKIRGLIPWTTETAEAKPALSDHTTYGCSLPICRNIHFKKM
jgi:hypothetical protein